jgi:hypothetical protein
MENIWKEALKIRTLAGVAVLCMFLVYTFRETIEKLALAGKSSELNLLLAFLLFALLIILGIAAFYAISKKEIDSDNGRPVAKVTSSEDVKGQQSGTNGKIEVDKSKRVDITQTGPDPQTPDPEKKT